MTLYAAQILLTTADKMNTGYRGPKGSTLPPEAAEYDLLNHPYVQNLIYLSNGLVLALFCQVPPSALHAHMYPFHAVPAVSEPPFHRPLVGRTTLLLGVNAARQHVVFFLVAGTSRGVAYSTSIRTPV
jgi:hypothetical protein